MTDADDEIVEGTRRELELLRAARFQEDAERESEVEEFVLKMDAMKRKLDCGNLIPHYYIDDLQEGLEMFPAREILASQATLCSLLHRTDTEVDLVTMVKQQAWVDVNKTKETIAGLKEETGQIKRELSERIAGLQQETDGLRWRKEAVIRNQETVIRILRQQLGLSEKVDSSDRPKDKEKQESEEESQDSALSDQTPRDVEAEFNTSLSRHIGSVTGWFRRRASLTNDPVQSLNDSFTLANLSEEAVSTSTRRLTVSPKLAARLSEETVQPKRKPPLSPLARMLSDEISVSDSKSTPLVAAGGS
mmetsp:Transcript_20902/g.48285  ORF Transcript_20902/g.48285 Transcript_20902/m.48285 type:complete len:305 (+) Transcript_20902:77-991(+)